MDDFAGLVLAKIREYDPYGGIPIRGLERVLTVPMRDNRISETDLAATVESLLDDGTIYLTSANSVSAENGYEPANLHLLKRCLRKISKENVFSSFQHAFRLARESAALLERHIQPHIEEMKQRYYKDTSDVVFAFSNQDVEDTSLTLYHKAFHFNQRAAVDEQLMIFNQLAFILKKQGQSSKVQPNSSFASFYKQVRDGKLDYLDDRVLEIVKTRLDSFAFQRLARNALKVGASPTYSVGFDGKPYAQVRFLCDNLRGDSVTSDLIARGLVKSPPKLDFRIPDLLYKTLDQQLFLLFRSVEIICERVNLECGMNAGRPE